MAWIQLPSVTVANGSKLVTVPGGYDLANVEAGWSFDVGSYRAEIQSVSAQDSNGVTTITLARNWDGSSVTAQPAQIVPIAGGELYVIQQLQDANDYAVQTHAAMRDYGTQDTDITLNPPGGDPVTIASMPKQDRLASEQRNANQQSFNAQLQQQQSDVNDLLSNKTADGDDTTPGALLQVGATVKQLDTTNSNIRFEPSVPWLLYCDFKKQEYKAYDGLAKGLVDKAYSEIVTHERASSRTGVDALSNVSTVGIDEPVFEYREGKPLGLSLFDVANQRVSWSETNGSSYPLGAPSDWAGELIQKNGITLDTMIKYPVASRDFVTNSKVGTASIYFYDDGSNAGVDDMMLFRFESRGDETAVLNILFNYESKLFTTTGYGGDFFEYEVVKLSNGFYRLAIICNGTTVANHTAYRIATYSDAVYPNIFGGMNFTETNYLMPYVASDSAIYSTDSDKVTIDLSQLGFNGEGGWTLVGKFRPVEVGGSTRRFSISNGTNGNKIDMYGETVFSLFVNVANQGDRFLVSNTLIDPSKMEGFVLRMEEGRLSLFMRGEQALSSYVGVGFEANKLGLGMSYSGSLLTANVFQYLGLCSAPLPDSECKELSK